MKQFDKKAHSNSCYRYRSINLNFNRIKLLFSLVGAFILLSCNSQNDTQLRKAFFDTVENEIELMSCAECSGQYIFKKGKILKSNDSIYYFLVYSVKSEVYEGRDLFTYNVNSSLASPLDQSIGKIIQDKELVTEISNVDFYKNLIQKKYPLEKDLKEYSEIVDELNDSSKELERDEYNSWTKENLEPDGFKKKIFRLSDLDFWMGGWELWLSDLDTGNSQLFYWRDLKGESDSLMMALSSNTTLFERLNMFEKITYEQISSSQYGNLIKNESPPKDVLKTNYVPVKVKVLYRDNVFYFIQRVKHNPVIEPQSRSFQEIKGEKKFLVGTFQTTLNGKPVYSFLTRNGEYGSLTWYSDKNNVNPFFSIIDNFIEVKNLWVDLYGQTTIQDND